MNILYQIVDNANNLYEPVYCNDAIDVYNQLEGFNLNIWTWVVLNRMGLI